MFTKIISNIFVLHTIKFLFEIILYVLKYTKLIIIYLQNI